jgi:hypothetical protein
MAISKVRNDEEIFRGIPKMYIFVELYLCVCVFVTCSLSQGMSSDKK